MKIMLDTDICVYLVKQKFPELNKKILSFKPGTIYISTVTFHELWNGVYKSKHIEKNSIALELFCASFEVVHFTAQASKMGGRIRAQLERSGKGIGPFDTLIAGHALSEGMKLISRNVREFSRIPELRVENWVDE